MDEIFERGTAVRWLGANPDGWTSDGYGRVKAFSERRIGFDGGVRKNGVPFGPAYELEIIGANGQLFDVWVAPDEVMVAL